MTTSYTLTGDLASILGGAVRPPRIIRATIGTNLGDVALVDLDANQVRTSGPVRLELNDDLTFSISLIATNSTGTNIPSGTLRYLVNVEYADVGSQTTYSWSSGYFELTTARDLSDVVGSDVAIPVTPLPSPALIDAATAANIDNAASETRVALNGLYARVRTPEAFGAVGDGVANDTTALSDMIAALTDGDTVHLRAGANYRYTAALVINGRKHLHWQGTGRLTFAATVTSSQGAVAALTFQGCEDIDATRLRLDIETQNQQYTGISITATSKRVKLHRARVYNARWVGIAVDDTCIDTVLDDCEGIRCYVGANVRGTGWKVIKGRYSSEWSQTQEYVDKGGVWDSSSLYYDGLIVNGTDWAILGVTLNDNGQSGIYGGGGLRRGSIQGCDIYGNWNKGIDLGATGVKTVSNSLDSITIAGNKARNNTTGDIHFRHCDKSTIVGNVIERTDAANTAGAILLNGVSLDNSIVGNVIAVANATAPGVFINNVDGSIGNTVVWNQVNATVKYSVTATANTLVDASDGLKFVSAIADGPVVDLTGIAAGIDAREILKGQGGADTYYQITVDKALRVQNAAGTPQDLRAGAVTADTGLTVGSGTAFLGDAALLRVPRTATTNAGYVWYDATTGRLMFRDGVTSISSALVTHNTATTTQLNSVADGVNTLGKFAGKQVWNSTTGRWVYASGSAAADVWKFLSDETTAHTPA